MSYDYALALANDRIRELEAERATLRAERDEARADTERLAMDALTALAAAGIGTPEKGYRGMDAGWLSHDIGTLARERDEARRALDVAEHDLRYVIAALSPSELVRLGRLLKEEVAALAVRPAETPEGR